MSRYNDGGNKEGGVELSFEDIKESAVERRCGVLSSGMQGCEGQPLVSMISKRERATGVL